MQKTFYLLTALFFLFTIQSNAQDYDYYNQLTKQADTLYAKGEYQQAVNYYNNAVALNNNLGKIGHRYYLACSYMHLGKADSAFLQLFHIAEKGRFSGYNKLAGDSCFQPLHADALRWENLLKIVKENGRNKVEALNKPPRN